MRRQSSRSRLKSYTQTEAIRQKDRETKEIELFREKYRELLRKDVIKANVLII